MTHPRLSARSAPFLPSGTIRELSEAARAAGTGQAPDELWTPRLFLDGTPAAVAVLDADCAICTSTTPWPGSTGYPSRSTSAVPCRR